VGDPPASTTARAAVCSAAGRRSCAASRRSPRCISCAGGPR